MSLCMCMADLGDIGRMGGKKQCKKGEKGMDRMGWQDG